MTEEPKKTLRDEFAMAALAGMMADPGSDHGFHDAASFTEAVTKSAYVYADAMMAARSAKDGG